MHEAKEGRLATCSALQCAVRLAAAAIDTVSEWSKLLQPKSANVLGYGARLYLGQPTGKIPTTSPPELA